MSRWKNKSFARTVLNEESSLDSSKSILLFNTLLAMLLICRLSVSISPIDTGLLLVFVMKYSSQQHSALLPFCTLLLPSRWEIVVFTTIKHTDTQRRAVRLHLRENAKKNRTKKVSAIHYINLSLRSCLHEGKFFRGNSFFLYILKWCSSILQLVGLK